LRPRARQEKRQELWQQSGYQHHGGWFARNGYVCLTIDTVQLGEIEGLHHGTISLQHWWELGGYNPGRR